MICVSMPNFFLSSTSPVTASMMLAFTNGMTHFSYRSKPLSASSSRDSARTKPTRIRPISISANPAAKATRSTSFASAPKSS